MNIRNAQYRNDFSLIDETSTSPYSIKYTKAYLHHLFRTQEVLGLRIASQQNLHFYIALMKKMREEIINDSFETWANNFLLKYEGELL